MAGQAWNLPSFGDPWRPPADAKELGIGVVGAGGVANGAHLPEYQKAGYRVVAAADVNTRAADETAARWSLAAAYGDHRRLLERPDVDVVLVCTPPEARRAVVLDAVAAGKHVLVEKPFAHHYADALAMVQAAEAAGVRLAVSQNRRWMASHRAARWLVDEGALGSVYNVAYTCRDNQEYLVGSWYERHEDFLFIEFAVHHIDLLLYWAGAEPDRVYAQQFRSPAQRFAHPMVATVVLSFPGDGQAVLDMSDVTEYDRGDTFRVEGTDGLVQSHAGGLCLWQADGRVIRQPTPVPSFAASMGSLLEAVLLRRDPPVSGRVNLATVRTYLSACLSASEHRPVSPREIGGAVLAQE